ncbi:MAG: hypothetical protein M3174_04660 [Actinomycetota bacterium]|nr:hypothetical protein [Actinomycetota bacterium]
MTLLLAGSILLIAGSAIALISGWANAEESHIWTSIAATAAAAVLLVIAFYRSKATASAVGGDDERRGAEIDPEIAADREERAQSKYARATSRGQDAGGGDDQTQVLAPDAPPPGGPEADASAAGAATATTVGPPAGEGDAHAMGAGDAEQPDAGGGESSGASVVAIAKTNKFHRPECRFASAKNAEKLTRSEAESRGFAPCGSCNP